MSTLDPVTTSPDSMSISAVAAAVREQAPLVQCITNYVSMDVAANVLNAVGASPAMVHDPHEAGEFARLASAVAVNIGTPSPRWVEGMTAAARAAHDVGTPWVLDPVAVGATTYRRETVSSLLEHEPTVIRGNASEIWALATAQAHGRGVDSLADATEVVDAAQDLATRVGCVVVVSGVQDVVTDGTRTAVVHGGDPRMPMITALGCSATALVAACCGVCSDPFAASVTAMAMLACAGESAGRRAGGPGSLRVALLDDLAVLDAASLDAVRVDRR